MSVILPATAPPDPSPESGLPQSTGPCLANSRLEQLLAGQLAGVELVWAERHLERCPACNQRLLNLAGPIPNGRNSLTAGETPPNARTLGVLDKIAGASPFPNPSLCVTGAAEIQSLPEVLAGFVDVSFVGRGGAGTVYRARQESLGRWVALKVLSVETASRSATQAQREAQALARLNHPHVVTVHEAHLLQVPPFLVMEWVSGGSLQERLQFGPLSVADATTLARQMAEAVAAVHALGLIHRDLKPANVLLAGPSPGEAPPDRGSPGLIAKITDFGLALTTQSLTRTTMEGLAVGTPAYMAPEQTGLRLGLEKVGPACDIYGIGAVIFAALTGRPPHEGDTPMATLAHVAWEEVPCLRDLRSDVPMDLATIVSKCLRPLPGERYRSAIELRDDLERYQRGKPILARDYTPRERVRNWIHRHPTLTVAAGLGGTLLLASVLGVTYHLAELERNLVELQGEQRRVAEALNEARQATTAERQLRSVTVQQATMAHSVMLKSLQFRNSINEDQLELVNQIRRFYHTQVQSAAHLETELAEILGEGLTILCSLESTDLQRPKWAEEDSELVLWLAREHLQSPSLIQNRAQVLHVRWAMFKHQRRSAEAEAALSEILGLTERYANDSSVVVPPNFLPLLIAMLWNAEDWPRALQVVEQALQREQNQFPNASRTVESWNKLLALQSQRMGLLHQLERWDSAQQVLQQCLELSQRIPCDDASMAHLFNIQRMRLVSQHLQHAWPYLSDHQRLNLLHLGRELFTTLNLSAVAMREESLALIEWAATLESLPEGLVATQELDSNWEVIQRQAATFSSWEMRNIFLPSLTNLRVRQAARLVAAGQFAAALQVARDSLDHVQILNPGTAAYDSLCVELLDLAAQACHGLGRGAEELSYLLRAADQATGQERNKFEQRLAEAAHQQGIPLPAVRPPNPNSEEPPAVLLPNTIGR